MYIHILKELAMTKTKVYKGRMQEDMPIAYNQEFRDLQKTEAYTNMTIETRRGFPNSHLFSNFFFTEQRMQLRTDFTFVPISLRKPEERKLLHSGSIKFTE